MIDYLKKEVLRLQLVKALEKQSRNPDDLKIFSTRVYASVLEKYELNKKLQHRLLFSPLSIKQLDSMIEIFYEGEFIREDKFKQLKSLIGGV